MTSKTPCCLLQLNTDLGYGVIKTTNSSTTQNIIADNRMKYITCHVSKRVKTDVIQ